MFKLLGSNIHYQKNKIIVTFIFLDLHQHLRHSSLLYDRWIRERSVGRRLPLQSHRMTMMFQRFSVTRWGNSLCHSCVGRNPAKKRNQYNFGFFLILSFSPRICSVIARHEAIHFQYARSSRTHEKRAPKDSFWEFGPRGPHWRWWILEKCVFMGFLLLW